MNTIPEKQNETQSMNFLFGQRSLYSTAKRLSVSRMTIALLVAVVGPIITAVNNASGVYVGMVAIVYLLVDNLFLERFESEKRTNATKVQEMFDTYVLGLPWNSYVAGKRADAELIGGVLDSNPVKDFSKLKDWYAKEVGNVDLPLARFLCQRSNAWWDSKLRNAYVGLWITVLVNLLISVGVLSVILNLTVAQLILGIVVPSLPLFEVAVKQIRDNQESANTIAGLKGDIDNAVDRMFAGEVIEYVDSVSRVFQDQLFRHRSKCPMVFDWVYLLARDRQEKQMQFSIKSKVEEYLKKGVTHSK